jgi:hypothetical protein
MNYSIPLITFSNNNKYCINEDAKQFLESIDESIKLSIIVVVGKYRTGLFIFNKEKVIL